MIHIRNLAIVTSLVLSGVVAAEQLALGIALAITILLGLMKV